MYHISNRTSKLPVDITTIHGEQTCGSHGKMDCRQREITLGHLLFILTAIECWRFLEKFSIVFPLFFSVATTCYSLTEKPVIGEL